MATDYISTTPWDDPLNPWPVYSIATVGGGGIAAASIVTLSQFDPTVATGGRALLFENAGSEFMLFNNNEGWYVGDSDNTFFLATSSRQIPVKAAGAANGWTKVSPAGTVANLAVTPDTTSQTDWSKRRLWNLNG
jgi:hypothetical protein